MTTPDPTNPARPAHHGTANFRGTCWIRKSDGLEVVVVTDSDPTSTRYKRQLRLKDIATGRHFWGTPDRLRRTYHPMCPAASAALEQFRWPAPRTAGR